MSYLESLTAFQGARFGTATAPPPTDQAARRSAVSMLTDEVASGYKPTLPGSFFWDSSAQNPDLGRMLQDAEAMLAHPRVESALSYYKSGTAGAEVEVEDASSPEHGEFLKSEALRFLQRGRAPSQRSYEYGRGACEVVYTDEEGPLRLAAMHPFNGLDCRVLTLQKKYAGVRVQGLPGRQQALPGPVHGLPAKAFWLSHNRRYSRWYGVPRVYASWRPWRRLAGRDGAEDIIDGGVYRFAFPAPIGRYPHEDVPGNDSWGAPGAGTGVRVQSRDRMRQMLEELKAGGVVVMSSRRDDKGQYVWDLDWPDRSLDVSGLMAYTDDLEKAISLGIGVPPELLEASEVGSGYSGRMIPLEAFYIGQQSNLEELLTEWCAQIGLPLLRWNYGPHAWARLQAVDLLKTRMKRMAALGQGEKGQEPPAQPGRPPASPGQGPVRFSTGEANPWQPYEGPRGGKGWKRSDTGAVRYQQERPSASDPGEPEGGGKKPGGEAREKYESERAAWEGRAKARQERLDKVEEAEGRVADAKSDWDDFDGDIVKLPAHAIGHDGPAEFAHAVEAGKEHAAEAPARAAAAVEAAAKALAGAGIDAGKALGGARKIAEKIAAKCGRWKAALDAAAKCHAAWLAAAPGPEPAEYKAPPEPDQREVPPPESHAKAEAVMEAVREDDSVGPDDPRWLAAVAAFEKEEEAWQALQDEAAEEYDKAYAAWEKEAERGEKAYERARDAWDARSERHATLLARAEAAWDRADTLQGEVSDLGSDLSAELDDSTAFDDAREAIEVEEADDPEPDEPEDEGEEEEGDDAGGDE